MAWMLFLVEMAGMSLTPETNRHHVLWTRSQFRNLGGAALELRNLKNLVVEIDCGVHRELHDAIDPVNFRPLEHGRAVFRGSNLDEIDEMTTIEAIDYLIAHAASVSVNNYFSPKTNLMAAKLEDNLRSQRGFVALGMAKQLR